MTKKIFGILVIAILAQFVIGIGNSYAYIVTWHDWDFYSVVWVDGDVESEGTEAGEEASYYYNDRNRGRAMAKRFILKSEARATSNGVGNIESLSLFYTRMKVKEGSRGERVPCYFDANLSGILRGQGDDFDSNVSFELFVYNYNILGDGLTLADLAQDPDELPDDPKWGGEGEVFYDYATYGGENWVIDETYSDLIYPKVGKNYWVLAGLYTEASADASRAVSDFYGPERGFRMNVTPVPEPATTALFVLGGLGLGIIRKRKIG